MTTSTRAWAIVNRKTSEIRIAMSSWYSIYAIYPSRRKAYNALNQTPADKKKLYRIAPVRVALVG